MRNYRDMWKFAPLLKTTIWGGGRIIPFKGLNSELSEIGESWEVSGVPGAESVVDGGPDDGLTLTQLLKRHGASLLGKRNYKRFGDYFPLLVKLIDANADLSVQVHPDDALAHSRGYANGKTEMWYVLGSERKARIADGFNRVVEPSELDSLLSDGSIEKVLRYMDVAEGEAYLIPAGRVHAICGGTFVIEIQQSCDLTYRLYDYHRRDSQGRERELHVDLAREAVNFNDTFGEKIGYQSLQGIPVNLVKSAYFSVNLLQTDSEFIRDYSESDTFVVLIAARGEADITCGPDTVRLRRGNSLLIPASATGITITPRDKTTILETYVS